MAIQSKASNTRNKKDVQARAEFASVASTKEFLKLKSPEAQLLYGVYQSAVQSKTPHEEILPLIEKALSSELGLSQDVAASVATEVLDRFSSGAFQQTLLETQAPFISITLSDYQNFSEMCHSIPDFPFLAKTLLLSLIVFYRHNYHPSNWVRYDRKNIFYLAGLYLKPASTQEMLTQFLHKTCGLNMRVIGSNQPIVCFDFAWIHDQPAPGDPQNPVLNLGPLSPAALRDVVAKVEKAPDVQPPSPEEEEF